MFARYYSLFYESLSLQHKGKICKIPKLEKRNSKDLESNSNKLKFSNACILAAWFFVDISKICKKFVYMFSHFFYVKLQEFTEFKKETWEDRSTILF